MDHRPGRSSRMRFVAKLWRLDWAERAALAEAVLCLGAARLLIVSLPFRWLAPILGRARSETPGTSAVGREGILTRLSWALRSAGSRLPWRSKCLEQAVAARLMLGLRGIPYTLYLGADLRKEALVAHAWVRTGDFIVTGAEGREAFAVMQTFAGRG